MAYIAPIHRPNSIRHALRASLFPDEEDCLVVAKANRLEFWKFDGDTQLLKLADTKVINGTISMMQKMRPRESETDLLFVGTERFQYFSLLWNPEEEVLETTTSFFDVNVKYMRDSQSQDKCLADPTGRFMVVLLWEGVLNVLRMKVHKAKRKEIDWMDQIRIRELFIKSATFLHAETGHPKLAILYQTRTDIPDSHLVTYRLFTDDNNTEISRFEAKDQIDIMEIHDPSASMLIPVGKGEEEQKRYIVRNAAQARAQLGGLIVVSEMRLLYYDDAAKKRVETPLREASIFVAWAEYDVSHYFIGDDYGTMWLLTILLEGAVVTGMHMKKIGSTSRANSLVYIGNNLLFVGSHYGDSQVWRVDINNGQMELVPELPMPNISPVLDFNIMDMGNREGDEQTTNEYSSGQAKIVTGSGVFKDGSLRTVRSGVGLDYIGMLTEMKGIRALFPIRSRGNSKYDTLIVSLLTETRVFLFDPTGEIEEVESFKDMNLKDQTLLAQNLPNGMLLQVTPHAVHLLSNESGPVGFPWTPADGFITNASANDTYILLSIDGKSLVSLAIEDHLIFQGQKDLGDQDQVACIHTPPQYPKIGVVGFWKSGSISIVNMMNLEPLHGELLRRRDDNTSVPRDIVLAQILPPETSGPTLFVSMDDGFVITFNVSKTDFELSGRKSVVLGTRHARLQLQPRPNAPELFNVFSTSEHPSLIYGADGRIVYSAVTAEDATCVCTFDTEAFPGSIVVATDEDLKVAVIDNERRTHVQPLEMGQTVRRLAYSKAERVFGLGCVKRQVVNNEEIITSVFKLVDEVKFDQVGQDFPLDGSTGIEMIEAVIRVELPDSYGNRVERFIVGTSCINDIQPGVSAARDEYQGRILVLGVDSERNPYLVGERGLKGACRGLATIGDYIVAALVKTVVVYQYNETSTTSCSLERLASYRPSTYPTDVAVEGNTIAVADLMKSMTLVQFTPPAEGQCAKLTDVGRHHQAAWATSVCHVEGSSWLETDANGNLMVLRRNEAGVTEEDKKRMEITSELNLGEMVNRARKVTVDATPNAVVVPRAFLGTVEGGVYLFGTIAPQHQDLLIRFQSKLANMIESTGLLKFDNYRSFRNEEREAEMPFRFVDGELIERFLDQDERMQEEMVEGLGPDVESMRNLVEELKRLH
ncbi:mono-functional DNA-alkylating methyl methanesulfonate N-term-domain-containing protein [Pseudomassariella vexata]|uniref:DNA damage-binding protein 1 n=1 Tax=Pseudomassariella vexata TaxID=1141098 RepID=A0A1Y2DGF7_9PEZI|nr:mono-functional DNA-alkylating methyl methanesulfonate N-term-domain-containing protein [Pseudomassariella vexata]ORY58164.1 mono-functional DNA-alkylating methyl methanesulfonate N-term-domain-containing protein [Pseudomassariella vexata]